MIPRRWHLDINRASFSTIDSRCMRLFCQPPEIIRTTLFDSNDLLLDGVVKQRCVLILRQAHRRFAHEACRGTGKSSARIWFAEYSRAHTTDRARRLSSSRMRHGLCHVNIAHVAFARSPAVHKTCGHLAYLSAAEPEGWIQPMQPSTNLAT